MYDMRTFESLVTLFSLNLILISFVCTLLLMACVEFEDIIWKVQIILIRIFHLRSSNENSIERRSDCFDGDDIHSLA